jgi:flotillin
MTPEEVNHDRLKFAEEMAQEIHEDFDRLGLALDTLKVQSVNDEVSYLDSIGRERLAAVLSSAEIAESSAKADAEEAQAEANRTGQIAHEQAENAIKQRENDFRRVQAELEATAKAEEERADQAAKTARATAEQRLQEIRSRLERLRLQADVVLPAESERKAQEMRSRSEAASIAADGEALAEVMGMMTEIWIKAGDDARDLFLTAGDTQLEENLADLIRRSIISKADAARSAREGLQHKLMTTQRPWWWPG